MRLRWLALALVLLPMLAWAGLRPIYGGELIVWSPTEPQTTDPTRAWSPVEVMLTNALGISLEELLEAPPTLSGATVHMVLRPDATWPDGTALDARGLSHVLRNALLQSPVALPPFTLRASGNEVFADLSTPLADEDRYLLLPWLRVTRDGDGPFKVGKTGYPMNPSALGGRPFVDGLRVELHEGKKVEPPPDGLVLSQPGRDGRPIFALTKPNGGAVDALRAALATVDRAAIARFFVRSSARVPDGWPLPAAPSTTPSAGNSVVVVAVDASERDLKTVAERLQILLRNQGITARIAAEDRSAYLARLTAGDYDLALLALPPAPPLVQAATLLRYTSGRTAADQFWSRSDVAAAPFDSVPTLKSVANAAGATLLYVEDGKTLFGSRVRAVGAPVWDLNPAEMWLLPQAGSP